MRETITIREFAESLWKQFRKNRSADSQQEQMGEEEKPDSIEIWSETCWKSGFEIALKHGWLSPQDGQQADEPMRRSDAARILHEFLRWELGEPDEVDWGIAKELKDLYDCRVCAAHVAQMVCKGIMTAENQVFCGKEPFDRAEAEETIERLLNPSTRLQAPSKQQGNASMQQQDPQKHLPNFSEDVIAEELETEHTEIRAIKLTASEARQLVKEQKELLFLDVRTAGEFEIFHPEGAKSLPLLQLMTNPSCVGENRKRPILLGCDGGYRSEIAAECLSDAGYEEVYYFGWGTKAF